MRCDIDSAIPYIIQIHMFGSEHFALATCSHSSIQIFIFPPSYLLTFNYISPWNKNSHHLHRTPSKQVLFKFPGQEETDPTFLHAICSATSLLLLLPCFCRLTVVYLLLWVSGQWDTACKNVKNK